MASLSHRMFLTAIAFACIFLSASAPANALTPANTVIPISSTSITDSSTLNISVAPLISSITVKAVSGIAWQLSATNTIISEGQSQVYQYRFAHNGNIGITPVTDKFYITVSGTWVQGVYQDAGCTIAATNTVQLPPNSGNTYTFYVKVTAPTGSSAGQSSTTTVVVENDYYHTNLTNDPFGDPDRISNVVTTSVPDTTSPSLALTSPASSVSTSTVASVLVSGTAEIGATASIGISPANSTQSLTIGAGGAFSQTINLSQGQNSITVLVQDSSGNISIATRTINVDSFVPLAAITSPPMGSSISGTVAVTGTASDLNFKEYSLHYGPGTSPLNWALITASSTTQITNGVLGNWITSSLYGDYTLRLTSVDVYGNTSVATTTVMAGNTSAVSGTIEAGKWQMVSVPGIPYNPDPTSWLGTGRYEIQRWDPTMASPDPYLYKYVRSFSAVAGVGFWVKSYGTPISYSVPAWVSNTTQQYVIPIYTGWNQIGNPYNRDILWDYFSVRNTSLNQTKTLTDAIASGWIDASFYSYDNNNYTPHIQGENLSPNKGYFIKSFVNGEIIIDPGAGRPGGLAKIIRPKYEWKLQISASSGELSDTDNFAAILKGGNDELDPEDSGEPPLVEPYLTLNFPHEEWTGTAAGRYSKDVRAEAQQQQPDAPPVKVWTFIVETSEKDTPITVSWPNASTLPENYLFEIRDDETGTTLDPRRDGSYQFTAAAKTKRRFTLTAKKTGVIQQVTMPFSLSAGWNLISVPLEPEETDARAQLASIFPQPTIYQYHERKIFDANSAERVDIQAGIAYWIYSDQPQEVSFRGAPTEVSKPVDVPLAQDWNLIGNPYDTPISFGDNISFIIGSETLNLTQAVASGWIDGKLYRYDPVSDGYETIGTGLQLQPRQGYILRVFKKCTVRFGQ